MNDAAKQLEQFFHDNIPLARATGARIAHYDAQRLEVHAPLTPNANHHGTAFGGSLYVVALAAGWGLATLILQEANTPAALFVRNAQADYLRPVTGELQAVATRPPAHAVNAFVADIEQQGRGQLEITINMDYEGVRAFELHARFTAIARS